MKLSKLLLIALLMCASLPAMAQMNDTYVIPVTANARGAFGTHWMTRFSLFNPQLDYPLTISVTFLPTGGAQGAEELVEIPANSLATSDNILDDLFDVTSGSGSLLVAAFHEDQVAGVPNTVIARSFLVNSDTFNNHPNGTYGQGIPGVWAGLLDFDYDKISSVAHNIRNEGVWRTNIGALNLGRCSVSVRVNVYDFDGNRVLTQAPLNVPPLGHIQDRLPIAIDNATVEFFVEDPCTNDDDRFAVVFPYTSTIDQRTGDPSYQQPTLLALAGNLYAKGGQQIDPLNVGKKLDSSIARNVRSQVERRGKASLVRTESGWKIEK
ncbi:MAG TPA: hypothetical protein VEK57_10380 [Thermoanaerobaculia bacterium]|nr:hypothetical protein [Thermoanaerobaculia bacterium]